jgi:hypothetical protein
MVETLSGSFAVLSPWADADPVPLKGLAPRLDNLVGKKIGLLQNGKRAGGPILKVAARLLQEKYPDITFTSFKGKLFSVTAQEPERVPEFDAWIKGVDAVLAAVAD